MSARARFVLRRLGATALSLLGVTIVAFALTNVVPGDPALAALGSLAAADPAAVEAYDEHHGLDEPLVEQYLNYVGHLAQGDLGISRITERPVLDDLREYAPASIELGLLAIVVAFVVGVTLGTVAGLLRDSWVDQVIRVGSLTGAAMPVFWLALVSFYLFSFKLQIFAGLGRLDPGMPPPPDVTGMYTIDALIAGDWETFMSALSHLLLPALVLAAYAVSVFTRMTRAAVLDVVGQDFVRTARAKGLSETYVATRHVLRAALVPIITVAGVMFGVMLSGTVFVESIFARPGLGEYAYRSATNLDLPAILGVTLLVAVIYVVVNLLVDVMYGVIDPRIRIR